MILKLVVGAVIGGFLGYLYHKKVGCKTGTCPITSSRNGSTLYGVILGLLISSTF
ncbi:MAG: DUF6132 family protein [Lachnospiraceae bacterium]